MCIFCVLRASVLPTEDGSFVLDFVNILRGGVLCGGILSAGVGCDDFLVLRFDAVLGFRYTELRTTFNTPRFCILLLLTSTQSLLFPPPFDF